MCSPLKRFAEFSTVNKPPNMEFERHLGRCAKHLIVCSSCAVPVTVRLRSVSEIVRH